MWGCVTSKTFDAFITTVIVLNIALMACDYWGIENDGSNYHHYDQAMQVRNGP